MLNKSFVKRKNVGNWPNVNPLDAFSRLAGLKPDDPNRLGRVLLHGEQLRSAVASMRELPDDPRTKAWRWGDEAELDFRRGSGPRPGVPTGVDANGIRQGGSGRRFELRLGQGRRGPPRAGRSLRKRARVWGRLPLRPKRSTYGLAGLGSSPPPHAHFSPRGSAESGSLSRRPSGSLLLHP